MKIYALAEVSEGQASIYDKDYQAFRGWVRRDNGGDRLWRPLIETEPYLDTSGHEERMSIGETIQIDINVSNLDKDRDYPIKKLSEKYPHATDKGILTQRYINGPIITYELGFQTRDDAATWLTLNN